MIRKSLTHRSLSVKAHSRGGSLCASQDRNLVAKLTWLGTFPSAAVTSEAMRSECLWISGQIAFGVSAKSFFAVQSATFTKRDMHDTTAASSTS